MQANIAVGLLETSSIALGVEACDVMVKMASVDLVKTNIIGKGKQTILIQGPVGEVESSLRAGVETLGKSLVHQFILRNVHQGVLDALEKRRPVERLEALGVIETKDAVACVQAADAAAKAAKVHLIDVKLVVGGGKGYVTMTGEVAAVRTAVGAGISAVPKEMLVGHTVIPQADPQLLAQFGK